MNDLSVIYYTSNYLDTANPYFLSNTQKQLYVAIGDLPIVVVSQLPTVLPHISRKQQTNIVFGSTERSHLNIYRQILLGCKSTRSTYVAMAEDDILYSYEHFHSQVPDKKDVFLYDMNKWSVFTWIKPAVYSFRMKRKVVNHLIARRETLIAALEERFERLEVLKKELEEKHPQIVNKEEALIKYWGDPGRYEDILGVTVRETDEFYSGCPSVVFSHKYAFGYLTQGKKKKLGDLLATEIPHWGQAKDVMKRYDKKYGE